MSQAFGAAYQNAERRFGGPLRHVQSFPVVGLTAAQIVGHDPERVSLTIVNWGAADIMITPDAGPTTTRGLRVAAGGGLVTMSLLEDATLTCQEFWGISGGAANTVYVLSVRRETQTTTPEVA